jgi:polyphenol oxidase
MKLLCSRENLNARAVKGACTGIVNQISFVNQDSNAKPCQSTRANGFMGKNEAMWLSAPNLQSKHGFSTRHGGTSLGAYTDLNLSQNVGDDPEHVERNRRTALEALGLERTRLARLRQVHSSEVITVTRDADLDATDPMKLPMADALVTNLENVTLVIETADCYPVLLEDLQAGVIGAAHCGWRGTSARILERTVDAMRTLGARPERIRAAIGPGICAARYVVNSDVVARFAESRFPEDAYLEGIGHPSESGIAQFLVNLERANAWVLTENNVLEENIWTSGRCSHDSDFFSHRRDHGQTGRMWSVIVKSSE